MGTMDLTGLIFSQGESQGSALVAPHRAASIPQGTPPIRSKVIVPPSNKRQQPKVIPTQ
jgi:hypothetical protein